MFFEKRGGNELFEKAGFGENGGGGIRAALCGMAVAGTGTTIETRLERAAIRWMFERMTVLMFAKVAHDAFYGGKDFFKFFIKEL